MPISLHEVSSESSVCRELRHKVYWRRHALESNTGRTKGATVESERPFQILHQQTNVMHASEGYRRMCSFRACAVSPTLNPGQVKAAASITAMSKPALALQNSRQTA